MRARTLNVILVAGLSWACSAPGGPPMSDVAVEINQTLEPEDYFISNGDTLRVQFINRPDWNHTSLVQPDGRASFMAVGDFFVAGMLTSQLDELLTPLYEDVTGSPYGEGELSVGIEVTAPRLISVLGQVVSPGVYALDVNRHTTLVDALAMAGGPFRGRAHLGSVLLVRWDSENQKQVSWTIDAREKHWGAEDTVLLQGYDMIFVPQANVDKINVWVDKYIRQMIPFPQLVIGAGT